jgi:hypothetical protein
MEIVNIHNKVFFNVFKLSASIFAKAFLYFSKNAEMTVFC